MRNKVNKQFLESETLPYRFGTFEGNIPGYLNTLNSLKGPTQCNSVYLYLIQS